MDHEEISASPLAMHVVPGAPCLNASMLNESPLSSAVAGRPCTTLLRACNAYGAPLNTGCARLTAALHIDGECSGRPCMPQTSARHALSICVLQSHVYRR